MLGVKTDHARFLLCLLAQRFLAAIDARQHAHAEREQEQADGDGAGEQGAGLVARGDAAGERGADFVVAVEAPRVMTAARTKASGMRMTRKRTACRPMSIHTAESAMLPAAAAASRVERRKLRRIASNIRLVARKTARVSRMR